jgi:predicted metal-dependent phosphoesterase TrpH
MTGRKFGTKQKNYFKNMNKPKKYSLQGKADLHIHSYYSRDAFSSPRLILKRAKEQGLDIIALTDHNSIKGAVKAQKIAPRFGIEVIIGEEINTKQGDILALFIKELIKPWKTISETIKEIHQQGGLAIIPHPGNWLLEGISKEDLLKVYKELDGIELLNSSWPGKIGRKENEEMNKSIFKLASTGGSDAHLASQVGCAYTVFPGKTKADLYKAIKEKATLPEGGQWSFKDNFFWMINSLRILYRRPLLPFIMLKRLFQRIF